MPSYVEKHSGKFRNDKKEVSNVKNEGFNGKYERLENKKVVRIYFMRRK